MTLQGNIGLSSDFFSFMTSDCTIYNLGLEETIRNALILSQFKRSLRQSPVQPHAFHMSKQRTPVVMLTRIRHNCSSLKGDRYRVNIAANPQCSCGSSIEDAQHNFFDCPQYTEERHSLIASQFSFEH